MMPIHINFVRPLPSGMRVLRYVLVACGLLMLGLVFLQYKQLSREKIALAWQLQDMQGIVRGLAYGPAASKRLAASAPDDAQAQAAEVLRQLDTPWNGLFEALENAIDNDIVIMAVAPDASQHSLTLQAMATNSAAAISFADRLQASRSLADIHLVQEEPLEDGARFPLAFSISAHWMTDGGVP